MSNTKRMNIRHLCTAILLTAFLFATPAVMSQYYEETQSYHRIGWISLGTGYHDVELGNVDESIDAMNRAITVYGSNMTYPEKKINDLSVTLGVRLGKLGAYAKYVRLEALEMDIIHNPALIPSNGRLDITGWYGEIGVSAHMHDSCPIYNNSATFLQRLVPYFGFGVARCYCTWDFDDMLIAVSDADTGELYHSFSADGSSYGFRPFLGLEFNVTPLFSIVGEGSYFFFDPIYPSRGANRELTFTDAAGEEKRVEVDYSGPQYEISIRYYFNLEDE